MYVFLLSPSSGLTNGSFSEVVYFSPIQSKLLLFSFWVSIIVTVLSQFVLLSWGTELLPCLFPSHWNWTLLIRSFQSRFLGLRYLWAVIPVGCDTCGLWYLWAVLPVGCDSTGPTLEPLFPTIPKLTNFGACALFSDCSLVWFSILVTWLCSFRRELI